MIVAIDQNICTGCRECAEVCPAYAIVGEQGKPQTIDTDRCVMCGQCVQKCKSYVSVLTHGKDAYERVKKERNIPDSVQEPLFAKLTGLLPERGEGLLQTKTDSPLCSALRQCGLPLQRNLAQSLEPLLRENYPQLFMLLALTGYTIPTSRRT